MSIVSLFDSLVQLLHNLHVTVFKLSIVSSILAALAVYTRSPTALKLLTGFGHGAYGVKEAGTCDDVHEVKTWFDNPFTNKKVFILICPSHQVC